MSTPAPPDYESIDWKEIEGRFRAGRLRAKLMRLAFTLTAIGIILLLINLAALFWLLHRALAGIALGVRSHRTRSGSLGACRPRAGDN